MTSTTPMVARWEWRTFGTRFPEVEARVMAVPHEPDVSHEIYIVAPRSDINVKVRGGQVDVKRLARTRRGLELWLPVLKAPFPLDANVVRAVFRFWGVAPPPLPSPSYPLEQFLSLVASIPLLQIAHVSKVRRRVVINDCRVEIATLRIDGREAQTVAVEMEDPDRVQRTVESLHLFGLENVNYVKALKRFTGTPDPSTPRRAREVASP